MSAVATADVVVIGAGVIGASCAYHLARAGARVVVVDAGAAMGDGSTARATGGFRCSFGTAINVRLSRLARERLRAFADETGVDPGFDPVGYLWLATRAAELEALRDAAVLQQREGLTDVRLVEDRAELAALAPYARLDGVVGAAWCPTDGTIRPTEVQRGYLEAAVRRGAEVRWASRVVGIDRRGEGGIDAVVTANGDRIATRCVVDAAGVWAARVAALVGVEVPVAPLRRQVAITAPTTALPARIPLTIWLDDAFHLRVRDGRVLLLRPTPGDPDDPWGTRVDADWLDAITADAPRRVPALADAAIDRGASWAGLYEMTPDHHALLGRAPACPELVLVAGNSGHGVMHAPALGLLAAELIVDGATRSLDAHALRPERFAEGDPIAGPALL